MSSQETSTKKGTPQRRYPNYLFIHHDELPASPLLGPAQDKQRRCSPRLLTEQLKQTTFPHAPHAWSSKLSPYPSRSIITSPSLSPPASPVPQSSQFVGTMSDAKAGDGDDVDAAGDDANEFAELEGPGGRFQKLCSERCWQLCAWI